MNDYFDYLDYFNRHDYFDYFGYFPSGPKTMVPNPKIPRTRCVTPTLNPIYHICVFYKIMHH